MSDHTEAEMPTPECNECGKWKPLDDALCSACARTFRETKELWEYWRRYDSMGTR